MKKLLRLLCAGVLMSALCVGFALTGCNDHITVEHEIETEYIYVNKCSSEITVHAFMMELGLDSLFVIPVNGNHVMINPYDQSWPLAWRRSLLTDSDYTTVSNGTNIVLQTRAREHDLSNLYNLNSYVYVSDSTTERPAISRTTVMYVFTDDFFEIDELPEK